MNNQLLDQLKQIDERIQETKKKESELLMSYFCDNYDMYMIESDENVVPSEKKVEKKQVTRYMFVEDILKIEDVMMRC